MNATHHCKYFCERCGDCIYCYGDDPCFDGGAHLAPIRTGVLTSPGPYETLWAAEAALEAEANRMAGGGFTLGACAQCGGNCDGHDCGTHAAGCVFGGFSKGYWLVVEGCPLSHEVGGE